MESVGKCALLAYHAKRRRQTGDVAYVGSNASDALRREKQAVIQWVAWFELLQVEGIRGKQSVDGRLGTVGNTQEDVVPLVV